MHSLNFAFALNTPSLIRYGSWLSRTACSPPCSEDEVRNIVHPLALPYALEHGGSITTHQFRISLHDLQGCADIRRQVDLQKLSGLHPRFERAEVAHLVNHEQVRLRDSRASFPRDLVSTLHMTT